MPWEAGQLRLYCVRLKTSSQPLLVPKLCTYTNINTAPWRHRWWGLKMGGRAKDPRCANLAGLNDALRQTANECQIPTVLFSWVRQSYQAHWRRWTGTSTVFFDSYSIWKKTHFCQLEVSCNYQSLKPQIEHQMYLVFVVLVSPPHRKH